MIELIEKENPIAHKALALCNDELSVYTCELSNGEVAHFHVVGDKLPDSIKSKDIINYLILNK